MWPHSYCSKDLKITSNLFCGDIDPSEQSRANMASLVYSSKLEAFADDNFKFYKNGREFSKRAEDTVGKEKFPSVFKILVQETRKNKGLF